MPAKKNTVFLEEVIEEPREKSGGSVVFEEFDEDDFFNISFEEIDGMEESVMPNAAAPAGPAAGQQSSRTEEMLFELLGKFSYESMLSEIRRTVRAEMDREAEGQESRVVDTPVMPAVSVEAEVAVAPAAPVVPVVPVVPEVVVAPVEPETPVVPAVFAEPESAVESAVSVEPEVLVTPAASAVSEMPAADVPAAEEVSAEFPIAEDVDMEEIDAMAALVAEEIRAEEQQAEETLAEETEPVFDIMQLLAAEAEKLANVSPIDMMDTYGEMVIEITLEELVHYNNTQQSKRRMK